MLGPDDIFEKPQARIRELIVKSEKKLTEISQETGISYSTLGNYNQGTRTPNAKNAQILADYFGVSIPYLLGLDDTPTLVNPRDTIPAKWIQELFSISHKKSELLLREYDSKKGYTYRCIVMTVTYVLSGFAGLKDGYVILGAKHEPVDYF